MAFDKAMAHLKTKGFGDRVIVPQEETATVEEAAAALGTAPAQIAKTMAFDVDGAAVLVLCAGDARVNSSKFKKFFHGKPHMIPGAAVEEAVGTRPAAFAPLALMRVWRFIWTSRLNVLTPSTRHAATTIAVWRSRCPSWRRRPTPRVGSMSAADGRARTRGSEACLEMLRPLAIGERPQSDESTSRRNG